MVFICTGYTAPQLWAIQIDGRGNVSDTHVAWKAGRHIPKISSPLLVGQELYVVSDTGVVTCFDARTGSQHWASRISGNYAASPLFADGRIYFFSQEGKTSVLQPGNDPPGSGRARLQPYRGTPAVADGAFFLRTDSHLYRVERR